MWCVTWRHVAGGTACDASPDVTLRVVRHVLANVTLLAAMACHISTDVTLRVVRHDMRHLTPYCGWNGVWRVTWNHIAGGADCDASTDVACHGMLLVFVNGPFGSGQHDWFKFDVSILEAAGIGETPYVSILKHFAHLHSINNTYTKCRKEQLHVGVGWSFRLFILAGIIKLKSRIPKRTAFFVHSW